MKSIFVVAMLLCLPALVQAQTLFLEIYGDKLPVRQVRDGQVDYLSSRDFFRALHGTVGWSAPDNRVTATVASHHLSFAWGNPFCEIDGTICNLVYEPIYYIDDLYLPINQLLSVLGSKLEQNFIYDPGRRSLLAVPPNVNVARVNVDEKLNGTLVEILLAQPLDYELFVTEGNWINVTFIGGKLDADELSREKPSPKVRRVRAFQFENSAQVSIQMRGDVVEYHHNGATYPSRIQISIEDSEFQPAVSDNEPNSPAGGYDPIDVIVIDPGHGGDFEGAVGKDGLVEKDVVLDIALKLEELLDRDPRFTPVLTRRQDHTVLLEQRALTANAVDGDLFVSIHCNSSPRRDAGGCETFYLAAASDDAARVTELLENSDFDIATPQVSGGRNDDLKFIVMDMLQTEYLHQSKLLAEAVQHSLQAGLNIKSRGINQAGFAVLNRVSMPSVLVETAFISNRVEEKLLGQESFRTSVAEAIYQGIVRFAAIYEKEVETDARSE